MQAFPFTSQVTYDEEGNPEYDRAVDADILRNLFKNYYSNGVFPNPSTNFQVVADEGMQVVVNPGACLIEGATGYETEKRTLVVQAAESTDRIDCVVLRLNDNIDFRNIDLYVVKGNSATEPPQLTRTGGVYEIGLANLYVSANSSTITTERITDTRLVTDRCGYAMPVQEFDTTALFDQLKAQVDANIELIQRAIDGTESQHLQSQIDVLSSDMTEAQESIEQHTQDISDINNSLGNVGKFVIFSSNVPMTIQCGNGYFGEVGIVTMTNYNIDIWENRIGMEFVDCICTTNYSSVANCTVVNNNTIYINGDLPETYQIKMKVYYK